MSIFDSIRNAIFRRGGQSPPATTRTAAAPTAAQTGGQSAGTVNRAPSTATGTTAPQAVPKTMPTGAAATAPAAQVDVEDVLENLAREKGQKLNWRSSIVDLMKLLDLDSSLENRKQLAHELGYTGNENDSATMNVWLHKQVMRKLAENGGRVPADLKD